MDVMVGNTIPPLPPFTLPFALQKTSSCQGWLGPQQGGSGSSAWAWMATAETSPSASILLASLPLSTSDALPVPSLGLCWASWNLSLGM